MHMASVWIWSVSGLDPERMERWCGRELDPLWIWSGSGLDPERARVWIWSGLSLDPSDWAACFRHQHVGKVVGFHLRSQVLNPRDRIWNLGDYSFIA